MKDLFLNGPLISITCDCGLRDVMDVRVDVESVIEWPKMYIRVCYMTVSSQRRERVIFFSSLTGSVAKFVFKRSRLS